MGPDRRGAKDNTDGDRAEALAEALLRRHGLRLLARNYRVKGGEIDLICQDGATLVFVEVRLRRNAAFGGAAASITRSKRQRLLLAARHYLLGRGERPCRFDCVLFSRLDPDAAEWIRNAFSADEA
ncbi:MAG: hypothetical protein RIR00_2209 [Pseudomonadota bacterium]|jgi:putative endonuclease